MKDIIEYYEDGGNANTDSSVAAEMKRQAKAWQEKLHKEFYEEANTIGRKGMYLVLKKKFPNDYPTKRFVGAWLRRQISNHGYLFCPSDNMSADMSTIEMKVIPTEKGHATDSSEDDE